MCTTTVPATAGEALAMLESAAGLQESALGFLAAQDGAAQEPTALPAQAVADRLRARSGPTRSRQRSGPGCCRFLIHG